MTGILLLLGVIIFCGFVVTMCGALGGLLFNLFALDGSKFISYIVYIMALMLLFSAFILIVFTCAGGPFPIKQ